MWQCQSIKEQFWRDFKTGTLLDTTRRNLDYLRTHQLGRIDEFLANADFEQADKEFIKKIFRNGKKTIESFDKMVRKCEDNEQYQELVRRKLSSLAPSERTSIFNVSSQNADFFYNLLRSHKIIPTEEASEREKAKTYLLTLHVYLKEKLQELQRRYEHLL